MSNIRQGKAKAILESSINSALAAVEIYNRPRAKYRLENYLVLMVIAWTKIFHAYFHKKIGEKYFYKDKKTGRYQKRDGERRAWELKECINSYKNTRRITYCQRL